MGTILVVGLIVGIGSIWFAKPASAHQIIIQEGDDIGVISFNHYEVAVVDQECDGHYVILEATYPEQEYPDIVRDENGCDAGEGRMSSPLDYFEMRVCEVLPGGPYPQYQCTGWVPT